MNKIYRSSRTFQKIFSLVLLCFFIVGWPACRGRPDPSEIGSKAEVEGAKMERTLTLAAYTTPREVYRNIILPAFIEEWKNKTGETVTFQDSYLGSGAQSRAVLAGFEADVLALSLEPDVKRVVDAGLITHDWKAGAHQGMVSRSIVVLAVRPGNPKGVRDWDDLGKPGLGILTPNVKTSGGAMWNVMAMFGAAMRGHTSAKKDDEESAGNLLSKVFGNVAIMDKGARESMITFEKGVGDVAVTYENEVLVGRKSGKSYDYVVPRSTILIENPAAVVDRYAEKHGNLDIARAFVAFLHSPKAQQAYAEYGLRAVDETAAPEAMARLPKTADCFTVQDLGGWARVDEVLFGDGKLYDRMIASLGRK